MKTILAFFVMVPAFGQAYVMRVQSRLNGMITYERNVVQGNITKVYDDQTGQYLFSVEESNGGRRAVMGSQTTLGFVIETARAPQDLRPGEETFGTMIFPMPNAPAQKLNVHVKATRAANGITVIDMTASAQSIVIIGRIGYRTNVRDPEWAENIMLYEGQKIVDDRLTRLR